MSIGLQFALVGLVGLGFGILTGWLLGARRSATAAAPDNRLELELKEQLTQRESDLAQERQKSSEATTARATAEAQKAAAETLLGEQRQLHERASQTARETQDKALADLREAFKALSADALKETAPEFLRLAEQSFGKLQETAKGDLSQRQEAIRGLVEPLKLQLETYQKRLQQSESAQSTTLGEVKKQLETLAAAKPVALQRDAAIAPRPQFQSGARTLG